MRRFAELDQMLENAVATALGLDRPHPETPRRVRAVPVKASRRHHHHHGAAAAKHERARAA